jgi:hypothetical protein
VRWCVRAGLRVPAVLWLASCPAGAPKEPGAEPEGWVAPDNDWPSSAPPDALVGAGFEVGQTVPDVRVRDQHDDETALWQFYGEIVVVTVGAVWCLPCQALAEDADAVLADFEGQGVVLVTVLEEDAGGLTPELSDAVGWAELYGDGHPILFDEEHLFAPAVSGEYPVVLGLDRELRVGVVLGGATTDDVRALIEASL